MIQYKNWLLEAMQFNFGTSIQGILLLNALAQRLFNTLKLTIISSVMVMNTSIILGVVSALKRGKFTDRAIRSVALFVTALPSYWIAQQYLLFTFQ